MNEDPAAGRFAVINAARLAGVALVLLGIFVSQKDTSLPVVAGYLLIGAGLLGVFVLPLVLARRWRTPPE